MSMLKVSTLLLCCCLLTGMVRAQSVAERELDVYEALLKDLHRSALADGRTLVVADTTSSRLMDTIREGRSVEVPDDAVQSFREVNRNPHALSTALVGRLQVQLLTDAKQTALWNGGGRVRGFSSVYPQAVGLITLSRVGFSSDETIAIVEYGLTQGGFNGGGRVYVLKLVDGSWQVTGLRIGGMWQA
jgi:hypothetical protein